jgi:hypothetical protein
MEPLAELVMIDPRRSAWAITSTNGSDRLRQALDDSVDELRQRRGGGGETARSHC